MAQGPIPYPVVFNADTNSIQYAYQSGWVNVPTSDFGITGLIGDVTASGTGIVTATIPAGTIVNAQVNASAAIAYSKLALSNSIVAGDLTSSSVTPAKISTSATDDFTFPRDVTVNRNFFVSPTVGATTVNVRFGDTTAATTGLKLSTQAGAQTSITFNANGDQWSLLNQVDNTFLVFDALNSVVTHTWYQHGGEAFTKVTTTQKNALTAVEGMMVYDTTLHAPCWYDGTVWQTMAHV